MQTTTVTGIGLAFMGILVLVIAQSVTIYVPDRIDIAKRVVNDLQGIQWCGDEIGCRNVALQDLHSFKWSQQDLNVLDMYQKAMDAKAIEQLFGSILVLLGSVLGILPLALEAIPRLFE